MLNQIHCSNPSIENNFIRSELEIAVKEVINSGKYILGEQVEYFEKEFASYLKTQFCIGVNSGTDALAIALKSLEIGFGDEVIIPSHTAVATASAVFSTGATVVFADVSETSMTIDPDSVSKLINTKTKAVIAVHLYGYPCELDQLNAICKQNGIFLLEDCAQAHGAEYMGNKVGTFGIFGCFSFYPTKNLGAIGDGGAIVTSDVELYRKCVALRQYGWNSDRTSILNSTVSRLDEIQAAILRVKLKYLDSNNQRRIEIAQQYRSSLNIETFIMPPESNQAKHVFHLFVIRINNRDKFICELEKSGIFPGIHYPKPVHMHPAFQKFYSKDRMLLKNTEILSEKILSLPMYPGLTEVEVSRVIEGIKSVR